MAQFNARYLKIRCCSRCERVGYQRRSATVSGDQADRIVLELSPGELISGTLHDQDGTAHAFRGWIELCAALDRAWQHTGQGVNEDAQSREEETC